MASYRIDSGKVQVLDLGGFNELRFCRHGPMLYNKNDLYVGKSLQKYGEFSHAEWQLFELLVGPGMTVVDVGANIGAHTIPLARRVLRGEGTVYAYEPQRLCFQLLCANVALNQLTNVKTVHAAVVGPKARDWEVVARLDPTHPHNFGGLPLGLEGAPGTHKDVVSAVSLDREAINHCRFLKIDVEGMECAVLRGAQELVMRDRPLIYCENDRREHSAELVTLLRDLGYELYWHLPLLFNPLNHANNREDLFPGVVSINMLGMPKGIRPPIDLPPVRAHDELWGEHPTSIRIPA